MWDMKACLLIACVMPCIYGQLYTSGNKIVSAAGSHVRLKCVNWYGAHQELFVVGGLEKRSAADIVLEIKSIGANCVRLPFSIDLWRINPVPPAFAVSGDPQCGHNAMDFFDCVIRRITDAGIMVVLNNHNSYAGWVGGGDMATRQGLWNMPNYSAYVWLDCLEHMAWRYRNNSLVVGMDIRNEIYDMDGTYITWGKSKDITSDWMAASYAASDRIEAVNPEMLIIVSGLCIGYDITEMTMFPGPSNALNRRKLMYTVHVYTWGLWWEQLSWASINLLSVALLLVGGLLMNAHARWLATMQKVDLVGVAVSAFGPFAVLHFAVFYIWYGVYQSIGCSAYTHTLGVTMAFYGVMAGLSVVFTVKSRVGIQAQHLWWFLVGFLCCAHALYFIGLSGVSQTYFMISNELSKWKLDRTPVPVWLGEFGSNWRDNRLVWRNLLDYLKNNNVNFAYWPLNGQTWDNLHSKWMDESFGLLNENYTNVRNPEFVSFIFG